MSPLDKILITLLLAALTFCIGFVLGVVTAGIKQNNCSPWKTPPPPPNG